MTFDEALRIAPEAIGELAREFVRRGDECLKADATSQATACTLLALRSASLLLGMGKLMERPLLDSWDVLARAFLESSDLLMHFRFNDEGTRRKVQYWYAGRADSAWKADHHKLEGFFRRLGRGEAELSTHWSAMTTFSHPTVFAAKNSAKNVAGWSLGFTSTATCDDVMVAKAADYLTALSKLIVVSTFDLPGWVSLGFDLSRIPTAVRFQEDSRSAVGPVHAMNAKITLPEGAYRSRTHKSSRPAKPKKAPST